MYLYIIFDMEKMKLSVEKILIGLLVAALGGTGVLVYRNHSRNIPSKETSTPSANVTATPTFTPTETPTPTASDEIKHMDALVTPYSNKKYAPITADNTTGFQTGWVIQNNGGDSWGDITFNDIHIDVYNGGENNDGVIFYRDGIPFDAGVGYTIYFSLNSNVEKDIPINVVNADTGAVIYSENIHATSTSNSYSISFTSNVSTWNGSVRFLIGGGSENHIDISALRIVGSSQIAIRTNHLGYQANSQKRCTFTYDAGDVFDVVKQDTNEVVYSGAIVNDAWNEYTAENNSYGDFTNVMEPGTYYIRAQIGVISHPFVIEENPYGDITNTVIRMLSLQRCGTGTSESWAHELAHPECHTSLAKVYQTESTFDVRGGWHDAGDYGRYIKTGSKAVSDLLFAYLYCPEMFGDNGNLPESGNGIPDILDEARFELEWMLKMQSPDGGVYNTVMTSNFPYDVSPEEDLQDLILFYQETTSTGDFGGAMAVASIVFKDFDQEFSNKCLDAALRANNYLNHNQELIDIVNPDGIIGGNFPDNFDEDARFYTNMGLYVATKDTMYLEEAKRQYEKSSDAAIGLSWVANGGYGRYIFLTNQESEKDDPEFYKVMVESLKSEALEILNYGLGNGYNTGLYMYGWGSNHDMCVNGITMSMAYDFTGDTRYQQYALEHLNYILGKNTLDLCYVTTFGYNSPTNVHNRLSVSHDVVFPGAMVGGANSFREDPVTQALPGNLPQAKVYSDSFESYSTNEIAINWNSALIHLLARVHQ